MVVSIGTASALSFTFILSSVLRILVPLSVCVHSLCYISWSFSKHIRWQTIISNIRRKLFYCLTSGATRLTKNLFFNTYCSIFQYYRPSLMLVILPTSFASPQGFQLLCSITVRVPKLTNTSTSYCSRKNCFSISAQLSRVYIIQEYFLKKKSIEDRIVH